MRQNGLRAASFVAVADVDPRIADQLLDLLAFAHVAAYAEPVPGRTGVYRDHHVPARPIDRLWVDRAATAAAREVLERSLPHLQAELEAAIAEGTVPMPLGGSAAAGPPAPGSAGAGSADPAGAAAGGAAAGGADPGPAPGGPGARAVGGTEPAGPTDAADTPDGGGSAPQDGSPVETGSAARGRGGSALDQAAVDARWRDIVASWDGPPADEPGQLPGRPGGTAPRGRSPGRGADAAFPPRDAFDLRNTGIPARPEDGTSPGTGAWRDGTGPGRRRTDRPDAPVPRPDLSGPRGPAVPREPAPPRDAADLPGPRDSVAPPEDEHFTPPEPAPHPPVPTAVRLGWAGVVGGPLLLVFVVAFGSYLPTWLPLAGITLLVGGFLVLVSRLHRSRPDDGDDDQDDGAVV